MIARHVLVFCSLFLLFFFVLSFPPLKGDGVQKRLGSSLTFFFFFDRFPPLSRSRGYVLCLCQVDVIFFVPKVFKNFVDFKFFFFQISPLRPEIRCARNAFFQ